MAVMAAPLVPIVIKAGAAGIRMAAPKVAKFLMDQGFKKASASAVKKAGSNIGRVTQQDAQKLVPHTITKGGRAAPVPKSKVQKKLTAAVKAAAKPKPKTKPMSRLEKIARVAIGQGEKGRRTGVALRNKKTGKLTGVSKKDQAIAKGARVAAGTAVAAGTLAGMSSGDKSYTIKSGDTLSQIAKKYGTTLGKLLDANPKFRGKDAAGRAKANRIKPGQKISLSGIVSPRKSVYQDTTKKEMAGMQMPKVKRKGGSKVAPSEKITKPSKVAPSEKTTPLKPPTSEKEAMERAIKRIKRETAARKESTKIKRKGGGRVGVGAALKGFGAVR